MLQFCRGQLRRRPWIAVAAAYALALQLALAGLLASGAANADGGALVVCSAHGGGAIDQSGGAPAGGHAPCALCCLAVAAGAVLPAAGVDFVQQTQLLAPITPPAPRPVARMRERARHQTGPPLFSV
jgi:hypothetical protein